MDAPATAFSYAAIQSLHRDRTQRIHAVFQPNSPHLADTGAASVAAAADYCLAHHVLEGAEAAARAGDTTTFDWYGAHPDANAATLSTSTAVGPRIVITPDLDRLPRSVFSETPYYVLGPDTTAARKVLRELATAAYNTGAQTGFGALLAAHAVVLVLLRPKQLGDSLDSWTITRLPGTVFSDHVDDPVVLARDLVHESGHNWLNDALAATASKISDDAQFYSPWKQTMRPAFGFLHACWAFPLTMIYTARVLSQTTGALHQFLTAYLDQQRSLLAPTADDHARVLALIPNADLRQRLHAVHHEALSL
ncbi:HEXXH motif-containing protein [Streptomyces sp. SceaMP-e96]|uniref:aKG-HExxH-type peptide beta-hydroxylase n=1 Tax=Streptomyces TaxID=1883 RepID=UPI000823DAFC|nr:HEXXH motif-containing putative peptide modification protein [Streptomyces sp. SceaMP-e96]MYT18043.1 HEXXH motif domain-containing protein [Streptomyces sp. SID4951]SCK50536.1 HEXXH motif-containing protein [Streptomyces sp. SceaMP-e96]